MRFNLDRGMWPEAGLAAFATLAVAWPLTELLREGTWIGPAILMVLLVAVVGSLLRSLDADPTLVVLSQALVATVAILFHYLRDTLSYGIIPWSDTLDRTTELLREAGTTLRTFAAPAPTNDGVEFLIVVVLTLTAISVDSIGVTGRAPATAGIPLAAAFLVSVSNNGHAMQPWFFAAAALGWLLMVAQQGSRLVTGWSSADRRESVGSHDVAFGPTGHRRLARILAVVTVLSALVAASALPHLPPTFFTEGLARNADGRSVGGGGGSVSFTETMDVTADLHNQSDDPVITYRTQQLLQDPLRVTAVHEFDGTTWAEPDYDLSEPVAGSLSPHPGNALPGVDESVRREFSELSVLSNGVKAPSLAVPSPVAEVTADTGMRWDPETSAVRLEEPVDSYDVTFMRLAPGGVSDLPDDIGEAEADPNEFAPYLEPSPTGVEAYTELTEQVIGDETNDLVIGQLLQQHFRSGIYTYDLNLLPGEGQDSSPIAHFLATQQGYCVQFATSMVMMARSQGIPARMALGFLPGEREPNGTWTIVASRAHTWPELWIDGMGWVRFEPTPAVRASQPPAYTQLNQGTAEADPTQESQATPTGEPTQDPGSADEDSWWDSTLDALRSAAPILLRALAVVLVIGLIMAVIAIAGRRHREAVLRNADTPQERIEGQWELLKRSLEDYGINPPPDKSPREMGEHYQDKAHLDRRAGESLGRATATLERARYAPAHQTEVSDDADMHKDVVHVLDSVSSDLPWNIRASAKLFPRSGVHYIRSVVASWFRRK